METGLRALSQTRDLRKGSARNRRALLARARAFLSTLVATGEANIDTDKYRKNIRADG